MQVTQEILDGTFKNLELAWCPALSGPTGFRAIDLSGNNRHGFISGTDPNIGWRATVNAPATTFSTLQTSGTYVYFPHSEGLSILGSMTMCIWYHPYTGASINQLISKGDTSSGEYEIFADFRSSANAIAWRPSAFRLVGGVFTGYMDRWVHICAVLNNATGEVKIFRNGAFMGWMNMDGSRSATTNNVAIGIRPAGLNPGSISVAEVRIYSRMLDVPEMVFQATKFGAGLARWERRRSRSRYVPVAPPSGSLLDSSYFMSFPG
jgi:hypothetical protein